MNMTLRNRLNGNEPRAWIPHLVACHPQLDGVNDAMEIPTIERTHIKARTIRAYGFPTHLVA